MDALQFECPKCEAVQYRTMRELISHCNDYHKDIHFGLRSINVSVIIILAYLCIQHHEFENAEIFYIEQKEALTHTFYVLHDKLYVMTMSEDQRMVHCNKCLHCSCGTYVCM